MRTLKGNSFKIPYTLLFFFLFLFLFTVFLNRHIFSWGEIDENQRQKNSFIYPFFMDLIQCFPPVFGGFQGIMGLGLDIVFL